MSELVSCARLSVGLPLRSISGRSTGVHLALQLAKLLEKLAGSDPRFLRFHHLVLGSLNMRRRGLRFKLDAL